MSIILLSSFWVTKTFKTKKIEEGEIPTAGKIIPVRNEINTIFKEFLESTFQPFFVEMKSPRKGELMGMESCGEEGCPGRITPNVYGLHWVKDNKDFYAGIYFKPNSLEVNKYEASIGWYEFTELKPETTVDLVNSYFRINFPSLKCQEKTEEEISYKECKAIWQNSQKNENGLSIISLKGKKHEVDQEEITFIYFCSVPPNGELYNKQSCLGK